MKLLRTWWRLLTDGARVHQEVEDEFQFHLDAYADDLIAKGVPEAEAHRRARVELGQLRGQTETYRDAVGFRPFDEFGADLRFGLRSLWRQPVFSAVAIVSLALGIGATTAMFSLIYAVLLHPFPYADSDRIMNPVIINHDRPQEVRWFAMTKSQFDTFKQAKSLESLLGFRNVNKELTGKELPEDVATVYLTENADSFFGVRALLGRGIEPSDAQSGGRPVAVLNYKFWQRHFQGDEAVLGRTLELDHEAYTIIGVMPRSFAFNDTLGVGDVYLPRSLLHDSVNPPIAYPYTPWIKLKQGVSRQAADAELGAIVRQFAKQFPARFPAKFDLQLQPIIVPFEQNTSHMLYLLFAGVLILLLIGCANCSILLLARGASRAQELAVRSAVGAPRWRIVRQLLVESMVVSLAGAVLGSSAAYWLAQLPLQLSPSSFPAESVIRIHAPILTFSVGLALACGIAFGLLPALRVSRTGAAQNLQAGTRLFSPAGRQKHFNLLIAGQIALTMVLLAAAGMAISAFMRLNQVPLGYDPKNVMEAGIVMHWNDPSAWNNIKSREQRAAFIERVRQNIAAVPGVLSVAVAIDSTPPYSGIERPFTIAGETNAATTEARVHMVSPEFFSTLRIPLVQGRLWNATENARGDFVAVVNQSFAHQYWPTRVATGHQVAIPGLVSVGPLVAVSPQSAGNREVIGVVGDARDDGLDRPVAPAIYVPYTTLMAPYAQFEVRTAGEPLSLLHSIRAAVQTVAPDQQIDSGASDLQQQIERDAQYSRQRLFSILFGFFSALAGLIALVGIFSVVSYSVSQRTTEFGVRVALGASRAHILWSASRSALSSVFAGIGMGLLAELLLKNFLARWMENHGGSVLSVVAVVALLAIGATLGSLLTARRATRISPIEALRYE